jgi:hypothetical protein
MTNHDQDTILFYAFRYALGRMTYAVYDVVELLIKYIDIISLNHKERMKIEIKRAMETNQAGWPCDVKEWNRLLEILENEK